MRNIIPLLVLIFSGTLYAQNANTKTLESFTELKVFDRIRVTLEKSTENKLVITGDDKDEVNISNKNGLLKIKMEFDNFMDGDEAKATLYYTSELTLIDTNENAKVVSDETLTASHIEIKTQEGGQIELKVQSEELYVKSVSGGEITLSGNAQQQEVTVNTGGKVYNENLETVTTNVTVSAGGRAEVNATDKVEAKVKAGGSIYIYGNPKAVDSNKVFGGKIEIIE
ncbi:head GIN domain-containing protein [Pareuzebyella sediminis]|uniref:head GIN domain-containing protein n=1 Tax=Pareuzebyella sediminis TaxID=2607998 RepID=UPI0011EF3C9A|nr:head GIN domain-containing protein [Pareuzebyella sediminis]